MKLLEISDSSSIFDVMHDLFLAQLSRAIYIIVVPNLADYIACFSSDFCSDVAFLEFSIGLRILLSERSHFEKTFFAISPRLAFFDHGLLGLVLVVLCHIDRLQDRLGMSHWRLIGAIALWRLLRIYRNSLSILSLVNLITDDIQLISGV